MIHKRNRGIADVEALPWEVARLRARLLRVDQLQHDLGDLSPGQDRVLTYCAKNSAPSRAFRNPRGGAPP